MSGPRDAVIVGAHITPQARRLPGHTNATITLAAIEGALADSGVPLSDVDGLNVLPGLDFAHGTRTFGYDLGIPFFWVGKWAPGPAAIIEAARAIETEQADTVIVASGQAGVYTDTASVAPWTRPSNEFIECWGLHTPSEFALAAKQYMLRYDVAPEKMSAPAAVIRNNGHINPEAVYYGRGPFTVEDVLASRMIADPYHLLDCSMTAEGGCALVLTTAERAQDLPGQAVRVLGGATESWSPAYTHPPTLDRVADLGRKAADRTFRQAGLGREDVDYFELYDNFSWEIIRYFEMLGYCGPGEGADFIAGGTIAPGGSHPIVSDGGTMSFSHTGESQRLQRVANAVRQLRGTSVVNQVADAEVAIVAQLGDIVLLGR